MSSLSAEEFMPLMISALFLSSHVEMALELTEPFRADRGMLVILPWLLQIEAGLTEHFPEIVKGSYIELIHPYLPLIYLPFCGYFFVTNHQRASAAQQRVVQGAALALVVLYLWMDYTSLGKPKNDLTAQMALAQTHEFWWWHGLFHVLQNGLIMLANRPHWIVAAPNDTDDKKAK